MIDELGHYVIAQPWPFVIDLEKCEGMWLATVDGQRLFDWAGYYASKLVGHNHAGLFESEYVARLVQAANNKTANPDFLTRECLDYYRLLYELAPDCMRGDDLEVYVVNSGAEAVENMMKYFINLYLQKHPGVSREASPRRFIYFDQAFHGRTVFALNVTQLAHDPTITRGYHGFDHGNYQVTFPSQDTSAPQSENDALTQASLEQIESILRVDAENIVGIIVEPLQGAGGHRVASKEFYQGLSQLAHDYDVSLGFDEVQTVGGQTGAFFAVDLFDLPLPPRAIACAKKLGCGAVYMLNPMDDRGVLDSTWGGTLADMVRFVQEIKIVRRERLVEQVPGKSERLVDHLKRLAGLYPGLMRNVRGLGLYQGWNMRTPLLKTRLQEIAMQEQNLLLLGAGPESIRLRPAITVTLEEIDMFADMLEVVLGKLN